MQKVAGVVMSFEETRIEQQRPPKLLTVRPSEAEKKKSTELLDVL